MAKLNPNEAPEGYVAIKPVISGCGGCVFYKKNGECSAHAMPCVIRNDGCINVIFKPRSTKLKKPARKPREWMAWAITWRDRSRPDENACIYNTRKQAQDMCNGFAAMVIRVKITEASNAK